MSSELLREMLIQYETITKRLNNSIDEATHLQNSLAIAKSEVTKNKNMKELIEEQIRCEKQLIQATR